MWRPAMAGSSSDNLDDQFAALGDPLIKGLTEVANTRPKDPIAFLATYLYNFANQNKSRLKTQESAALIGSTPPSAGERAAPQYAPPQYAPPQQAPPPQSPELAAAPLPPVPMAMPAHPSRAALPPTPGPPATPGAPEAAFSSDNRDEHGQSMLHFAAARAHSRGALLQLIREADVSPAYRDELYRTARDVSLQANLPENTREIDHWLLETAARGDVEKIAELAMEGYDHILDVVDDEGVSITEIVSQRGHTEMSLLLSTISAFEENRESLHELIREGKTDDVIDALSIPLQPSIENRLSGGRTIVAAKNAFGRCCLHIAVLGQQEQLSEHIARTFPETLRIGDNLERTALHLAMGIDNVETVSRILIKAGAKRVLKDLKGRQPSYYFMNKSDVLRLKEEEEAY